MVAAVLVALALVMLLAATGWGRSEPSPSGSGLVVPGAQASTPDRPQPRATIPAVAEESSPPRSLRIPSIGVDTRLIGLGLNADQTAEVPTVPSEAGWFDQGPTPGSAGSAVILGHVDSVEGPAVFFRLRELAAGDLVQVGLADGAVAHFEVTRSATYANERFPAQRVYAGSPDRPALNLVTCGGEYDSTRGGYQSNVVVFTRWLRTTR